MPSRFPVLFLATLFLTIAAFGLNARGQEQSNDNEPAPTAQAQPVRQIEKALLVRLVRSTLSAVDQANSTGNYTVLRDLAAPSFAARNTAATLATDFKPLRDNRVDLSPVLVLPIKLSRAPTLDEAGKLDIAGSVPGDPLTVAFWMRFEPVNGVWRLLDFSLNLVETEPATASNTGQDQAPKQEAVAPSAEAAELPSLTEDGVRSTPGGVPVPSPKPSVSDE